MNDSRQVVRRTARTEAFEANEIERWAERSSAA